MQPDISALLQCVTDVLLESQIKIGYSENPVGLYFPLDSLCRTLGMQTDEAGMDAFLQSLPDTELGHITVSRKGTRYCLTVPVEGVRYVHEHVRDSGFLTDLIALLAAHHHGLTIEAIRDVFERYSSCVVCRAVQDEEFDYLLYFADGKPDQYRYLISMEMGHASYHRFSPADFEAFGFQIS